MLKRCALILMSAVVLCGAAAVAADVDITGTWTASFDTQIGMQEYTYEFVVKDSVLTGEAKSNLGEGPITDPHKGVRVLLELLVGAHDKQVRAGGRPRMVRRHVVGDEVEDQPEAA